MGSIKSLQLAMGYTLYPERGRQCSHFAYQTWAANERGKRLPFCQMGGFFVWLDCGCDRFKDRLGWGSGHE